MLLMVLIKTYHALVYFALQLGLTGGTTDTLAGDTGFEFDRLSIDFLELFVQTVFKLNDSETLATQLCEDFLHRRLCLCNQGQLYGLDMREKDLTSSSCFFRVSPRSVDARRCESSSMILFCCIIFVSRSRSNSVSISFCKRMLSRWLATQKGGHKPQDSTSSSLERKASQEPELASPCYDGASSSPTRELLCCA